MRKVLLFHLVFFLACAPVFSQLYQLEGTTGLHKSAVTHFSSLLTGLNSGISLNTLAFFQKYHQKQDIYFDEAGVQLSVMKEATPGLAVGPTFYYNSIAGMMEKLSISYARKVSRFQIVLMPAVGYAHREKSILSELYFQLQFTTPIKGQWHLISYVQGLTHWLDWQRHGRSFQYLRLGLVEPRKWQIGFSLDLDQYGPTPILKSTPGIFVRKVIIQP